MRKLQIKGYGTALPKSYVEFGGERRYRVSADETQLQLAVEACQKALDKAGIVIQDIDLLVSASAVGIQPIPCTAALIHEQLAKVTSIPAMDINTTCTSFVTALDVVSHFIAAGSYQRVLVVSSEIGSRGLNPNQKESYELFGDGAAAFIFEATEQEKGVVASKQQTWSEGAHDTEIRGGLTALPPYEYSEKRKSDYQFDMKGIKILGLTAKKLPRMLSDFLESQNLSTKDIDFVIPHQASKALPLVMKKLSFKEEQYLNIVPKYGNMVSASIPFALAYAMDKNIIKEGQLIGLMGTAAGLTTNLLLLRL
ncbi:3-oxoacyl-[acyl-carrier-protein] synthase III C-terminal domain-containing protein [Streptococcus dentiloxodontae]